MTDIVRTLNYVMEAFVKSRSGKESKGSSLMIARKEKFEELFNEPQRNYFGMN